MGFDLRETALRYKKNYSIGSLLSRYGKFDSLTYVQYGRILVTN